MAKKNIENQSTERLRKLLSTYNILAIIGGIIAIVSISLYILDRVSDLLNREDNLDLLVLVSYCFSILLLTYLHIQTSRDLNRHTLLGTYS